LPEQEIERTKPSPVGKLRLDQLDSCRSEDHSAPRSDSPFGVTAPAVGGTLARILTFTSGPHDWQMLLADPIKHWKTGYSARTLAHCWEAADGFPPEIAEAFHRIHDDLLGNLKPILAVPEFKVPLPGGVRPSQNDLFVLARGAKGPVSIMVEGKVRESFGPTLGEWRADASRGKELRLRRLLETLGIVEVPADSIRYQLLHRAASAVITGEQFRATAAVVLIHSFNEERFGWSDYHSFAALFGVDAASGVVQRFNTNSRVPLFGVWIVGDAKFLAS
jgi:hypothetical protein